MVELSPTQQQTALILAGLAAAHRAAANAVAVGTEHADPGRAAAHAAMADVLEEYQEAVGIDAPVPLPSPHRDQPDALYDQVTGTWVEPGALNAD